MTNDIVRTIITISAITLGARIVVQGSRAKPPQDASGNRILVYGTVWKVFLVFGGLIFPALLVLGVLSTPDDGTHSRVAIIALILMVAGILFLIETTRTWLIFDDKQITKISPWHRPRTLRWSEITEVSYFEMGGRVLIFKRPGGPNIRVSVLLRGIGTLADEIEARLPRETYVSALKGLAFAAGETDIYNRTLWNPYKKHLRFAEKDRSMFPKSVLKAYRLVIDYFRTGNPRATRNQKP